MAEVMGPEIVSGDFFISAIACSVKRATNKKLVSDCVRNVAIDRMDQRLVGSTIKIQRKNAPRFRTANCGHRSKGKA